MWALIATIGGAQTRCLFTFVRRRVPRATLPPMIAAARRDPKV
jgi:hypothetical protein